MQFSRRISSLKPSPTVALNSLAKEMAKNGAPVINLSVGEPDFTTPEAIIQVAIAALKAGKTKYGAPGGGVELKTAISNKLKRDNHLDYLPEEIVAGIGAKEILFHLSLALLNEGDEVLIPAPYWVSYTTHCEAAGAIPVVIPMKTDSDSNFVLTPEDIEPFVTERTKAIILNSPNNPAGYVLNKDQLTSLGQYLTEKDWWVISDEIYEYMSYDSPHISMLHLVPSLRDRYVLVNGMSKGFAMTGWRVGYACGPKKLISLVKNLQSQSSTCIPGFIEAASTYALNQGPNLMADEIDTFKKRCELVSSLVAKIPDIGFIQPSGAFYLFIDVRNFLLKASKLNLPTSMAFAEYLLEKHHVAMVPGEAFGVSGFLRMSYASDNETLIEGLERFAKAVEELTN